ncbi:hypothetical protein LP420_39510 [Massilia sp. B-10]|nr:hypothetical protein LP420_39510 [Massilia sp. B-10]
MKAAMFHPCPAAALCALALLLSGCGADQRAGQISRAPPDSPRVFYTTNPGCTIDGVPGTRGHRADFARDRHLGSVLRHALHQRPSNGGRLCRACLRQARCMHTTNKLYLMFFMRFACSVGIAAGFCNTLTAQFDWIGKKWFDILIT